MGAHCFRNSCSHGLRERVEVRGRVEVDVADFIFDFGLNFVEADAGVKRLEHLGDGPHILLI